MAPIPSTLSPTYADITRWPIASSSVPLSLVWLRSVRISVYPRDY